MPQHQSPGSDTQVIESQPFKITPAEYVRPVMWSWTLHNILFLALPAIILAAVGIHDSRFFIVALMWIFIIMPAVLYLVFFKYGTSPLALAQIRNHTLQISDHEIIIRADLIPQTIIIPLNKISHASFSKQCYILHPAHPSHSIVAVPLHAFQTANYDSVNKILRPLTSDFTDA